MNEPRFIELLNLYVDQQLSPEEAAELEAEIHANPVRHRTYQQYCRMQKACAQLFEHERSAAPASAALSRAMADADRKIVTFPGESRPRSIWPIGFSIGAVAAAACVAFVVVRKADTGGPVQSGNFVARTDTAPVATNALVAAIVLTEAPQSAIAPTSADDFKPVFAVQPLRSGATKPGGLFISASGADAQLLDWTREVQLKPLRKVTPEELAFEQRSVADKPGTTQLSTTTVEEQMSAFQFTK